MTSETSEIISGAVPEAHGGPPVRSTFSDAYRNYVLTVLTVVYTLNYLDRGIVILLLQSIKDDLRLSDTQLGFLTGIAFGLFYAVMGVPLARWADRGDRVTLTSIAIGLWGVTVMLCVFVGNFAQLVVARVAAAVGESGCLPPTYSLVGDYFPHPRERTRAMTIYWLAAPVSALVSFIAGGWLNARYGWRMTFFLMGIPGLLAAVLVSTTIIEPRQSRVLKAGKATPMRDVLAALWNQPSSRHLAIALILLFMMGFGLAPWYAAFMIRSHHMATAELGVWLGLIFGGGGLIGVLLGGYVVGRWFVNREHDQLRFSALAIALLLPCFAFFLLLPHKYGALGALVPLIVAMNVFFAPVFALMQRLVKDEMRATALAVVMLLSNLIGMGLGPQVVGILSDALRPSLGQESLRYAMLIMSFTALWSAYHFWRAARTVREDLGVVARPQGSAPLVGPAA